MEGGKRKDILGKEKNKKINKRVQRREKRNGKGVKMEKRDGGKGKIHTKEEWPMEIK